MRRKSFRFEKSFLAHALALIASITIGMVSEASAHSFPEEEHPAAGQRIAAPPAEITIKFDAPIEKLFAKLEVLDAEGKNQTVGAPEISSDNLMLTVKLAPLKPGDYTVKWGVVCVDTHHTEGSYTFTVTGGSS